MTTSSKDQTVSRHQKHHDWSFMPNLLTATTGVGIGLAIASYLGWI